MSTKRIEFLADHRAGRQDLSPSLRALRHLDAARAKLESLQATRRQLKLDIERCVGERDAALAQVDELTREYDSQSSELRDLKKLLSAQATWITQLRADCLRLREKVLRRQPRPRNEDGPALTMLVLEKVAAQSSAAAETENPTATAPVTAGFVHEFMRRIRSGLHKYSR